MRHRATAPGLILTRGLALTGLCAGAARAERLQIRDGLWETTMKNPMTGERTHRECLEGRAEARSKQAARGSERMHHDRAEFEQQHADLHHGLRRRQRHGAGAMFVDGDHGGGEVTMHFDMGGRPMDMTMSWDAVRIGDCLSLAGRVSATLCRPYALGALLALLVLAAWGLRRTRPRADRCLRPADPRARRSPGRDRRPDRGRGRGDRALPRDRAWWREQRALDHLPLCRPRPAAGSPAPHQRDHRSGRSLPRSSSTCCASSGWAAIRPRIGPRAPRGRRTGRRRPPGRASCSIWPSWRSTPPRWAASTACSPSATPWFTASSARSTLRLAGSRWSAPMRPSSRSRSSP